MQSFLFHSPTKVIAGENVLLGIAEVMSELKGEKALLITDANLIKAGLIEPIQSAIASANMPNISIFDQVPPDSDLNSVEESISIGKKNKCDIIIAVGGGSVMDTAKVTNIGVTFGGKPIEFEGINTVPSKLMPLIAIPTTAGTGSEVSAVAMIKDHEQKRKLLFGSPFLFPDIAILDPALLTSLPKRLTAACGLDALTHSIEALTASTSNYISDGFSFSSIVMLFKDLQRATEEGDNLDLRFSTLVASTMAGLSFTNAGVGIIHALSHTIGSRFGTHHGLTNAVFLPYGMQFNFDVAYEKYAIAWRIVIANDIENELPAKSALATYIKKNKNETDNRKAAQHFINAIKHLIEDCGISISLKSIGVPQLTEKDTFELANNASFDPAIMFNPKEASVEDLQQILKEAY